MSTGEQIEHYRGIASSIRAAARVIGLAESRSSLFNLASTYEEVALRIEAAEAAATPPDRSAQTGGQAENRGPLALL